MTSSDQRFLVILGGVTVLAAGGLIFWGLRGAKGFNLAAERHQQATADVRRLEALKPYPKPENKNAKEKSLKDYAAALAKVQSALVGQPPKLDNVPSAEFGERLLKVVGKAKDALAAVPTEIPDNFALGFEGYTTNPARQNATGLLGYQLDGIGALFDILAQARPSEVTNFHREPLPEERAGTWEPPPGEVARPLPFELTFRGRERCLREFLNGLAASTDYYFVVRSMRVKNQRITGPTAAEAKFEKPKATTPIDPFGGGFVLPGDTTIPEPPATPEAPITPPPATPPATTPPPAGPTTPPPATAPAAESPTPETPATPPKPEPAKGEEGERILKPLVGDEELDVFLRIDLMLFRGDVKLPES